MSRSVKYVSQEHKPFLYVCVRVVICTSVCWQHICRCADRGALRAAPVPLCITGAQMCSSMSGQNKTKNRWSSHNTEW